MWREELVQDVRYAVRALRRQKAFATTVILTLALGIGANTAIFSVVSGVVLRPLPFPDPEQLVRVYITTPSVPQGGGVDGPYLEAFRNESASFRSFAAYEVSARYLRGSDGAERVMAVGADRSLFSTLGATPLHGRTFLPDDPVNVVVIGEMFWRQRLGGHASVIGSTLTSDGQAYNVIGVMPESFQFPYGAASLLSGVVSEARTDVWIPFPRALSGGRPAVIARLKPAVDLRAAQSELAVVAARREQSQPANAPVRGRGVRLAPLSDVVVGATVRRPLFFLFGAVGIVLALACANVTNLSLVRMTLRRREVAVRSALGANPRRLIRQFLVESLLLSFVGGAVGIALAKFGTDRLRLIAGAHVPRAHEVALDWRVFLFLFATCTVTAVAFGLVPALIARRTDTVTTLQDSGGHSTLGPGPRRLRSGLIVAEVALAFVLAIGGTLLVRELVRLRQTDAGFTSRNVVTFHLGHRMTPASDPRQFYEIAERVAALPGVRAAGLTQMLPLQNWGWTSTSGDFRVRGRTPSASPPFTIELRYVTPGYFDAIGIPLKKGRPFTAQDTREAPPVIVINETLARRTFGDDDPIGTLTTRGTVIGVVGDIRSVNLDRSAVPEIYYPAAQNWSQISDLGMTLVVSTHGRPEASIEAVRAVVRDVTPSYAIFNVKTMDRVIADSLSGFTMYLWLIASFAVVALVLALTGTYGVISYAAASRTREFAIRLALGAPDGRVARMVLRQGVVLTVVGLSAGLMGALAAAPLLANLPVSVRPPDLVTMIPVAVFLGVVAVLACWIPARRAARVEPMSVLRQEA